MIWRYGISFNTQKTSTVQNMHMYRKFESIFMLDNVRNGEQLVHYNCEIYD